MATMEQRQTMKTARVPYPYAAKGKRNLNKIEIHDKMPANYNNIQKDDSSNEIEIFGPSDESKVSLGFDPCCGSGAQALDTC